MTVRTIAMLGRAPGMRSKSLIGAGEKCLGRHDLVVLEDHVVRQGPKVLRVIAHSSAAG